MYLDFSPCGKRETCIWILVRVVNSLCGNLHLELESVLIDIWGANVIGAIDKG